MRFSNTRSNTSTDIKGVSSTNSMHLSHVYNGTFAAFRYFIHRSVCLCAKTFREERKFQRVFLMAQLSSQMRSIGPSAMHLKINASQLQLGRKTGECFSGRGDLKRLCHFLYEVRLHDVIMDSLHVCYGNSLMAFECRKNPSWTRTTITA